MSIIYLDNSATTKPCCEAVQAMTEAMTESYGNPSSLHALGTKAAELLLACRNELICALWGAGAMAKLPRKPGMKGGHEYGQLVFTASGTESDNLAIIGAIKASKIKNPEIIISDSEHPAVLSTVDALATKGITVHKLKTVAGKIDLDELKTCLNNNTALVSIMYVNNETGAIYALPEIFKAVKAFSSDIICHTDCVQAFQKIPFTPKKLGADMITVSAHKVHGVKGVGALWISEELIRKNKVLPIIFGGGQEMGIRSGTENLPGIAAFSAAVKANGSDKAGEKFLKEITPLREYLLEHLPCGVDINKPAGDFAPHIISIATHLPKSQPILNYLSALGIYVSSGSACSSHKNTVSHVLTAFGVSNRDADGTIRVSLAPTNTESDMLAFCAALDSGIRKLGKK